MPYQTPQWQDIEDFGTVVKSIVTNEPDRYASVTTQMIGAYGFVAPKHDCRERCYQIMSEELPVLCNTTRRWFVTVSLVQWDNMGSSEKVELVRSILDRIVAW